MCGFKTTLLNYKAQEVQYLLRFEHIITIKYKVCNDFEESTTTVSNNESSKDPKDA